jgi:ribonuclease P protein component
MTGEGSHDFARVRRIVKTDEFSSVFRLRPSQKTAHFVLYTQPSALSHARLGVVVAKRFAPRAVTRNTIKRVTRELFRLSALPALDCIVRLARPVNAKDGPATNTALKAAVRAEVEKLFTQQARDAARVARIAARSQAASVAPVAPVAPPPPAP